MASKINLVSVHQSADGQAVGTFDLQRDDLQDVRFQQSFPGNADAGAIGKMIVDRCYAIISAETVPAVGIIESMFARGSRDLPAPAPAPAN